MDVMCDESEESESIRVHPCPKESALSPYRVLHFQNRACVSAVNSSVAGGLREYQRPTLKVVVAEALSPGIRTVRV